MMPLRMEGCRARSAGKLLRPLKLLRWAVLGPLVAACAPKIPAAGDEQETQDTKPNDSSTAEDESSTSDVEESTTTEPETSTDTTTTQDNDTTSTPSETTSSSTTSTDTTTTTEESDGCKSNDDCQKEDPLHPICDVLDGNCVACTKNEECSDPEKPLCDLSAGECASCLSNDDCPSDTPNCIEQSCSRCDQLLGQCGDAACNLATGICLPQSQIWWVSSNAGCNDSVGTKKQPFCRAQVGLNKLLSSADKTGTLHLDGMLDKPLTFNDGGTYAVVAPNGVTLAGNWDGQPDGLTVTNNTTLYALGFSLSSAGGAGAKCNDATLYLEKSTLFEVWTTGIDATKCKIWLLDSTVTGAQNSGLTQNDGEWVIERTTVWNNFQNGILANGGNLRIVNSFFGNNGTGGGAVASLSLDGTTAQLVYVTFGHTGPTNNTQITCRGNEAPEVRNSIAVGGQDTTISGCSLDKVTNSVVDIAALKDKGNNLVLEMAPSADAWYQAPTASPPNLHLKDAKDTEVAKLADVAERSEDDPATDIDLDARPAAGAKDWPGADLPK